MKAALLMVLTGYLVLGVTCAARVPGDPFGLQRPEELRTICHEGITMRFATEMAKRHLVWHDGKEGRPLDYPGVCREGT